MSGLEGLKNRWGNLKCNIGPWLWRASGAGWACSGILVALALGHVLQDQPDDATELAGMVLQMAAVGVLGWRLGALQEHFGRRPWWRGPVQWLRDFPFEVPKSVTIKPEPIHVSTKVHPARMRTGVPDEMEKRVERLEGEVDSLWNSLDAAKEELTSQIREVEKEVEEHRAKRRKQIERLEGAIETLSLGDLKWEGVALSWLFLGPLLDGAPAIVTGLFSRML